MSHNECAVPLATSKQPPERAILSHTDCFGQCEIVGLNVIYAAVMPDKTFSAENVRL